VNWGNAAWLWGLVIPVALVAIWQRRGGREKYIVALTRVDIVSGQVAPVRWYGPRRPWCLCAAFILSIGALARPQWSALSGQGGEVAREIVIALDLSRSMAVRDVAPSRLKRAHEITRELLAGFGGERVALVIFSGVAFVQVPLSSDYQIMREFLPVLEPGYLPKGGSDYDAMLRAAEEAFSADKAVERFLYILSDGESTTDGWNGPLASLVHRGVTIVALGFGTMSGGELPVYAENEKLPIRSRLESRLLQTLARETGGFYREVDENFAVADMLPTGAGARSNLRRSKRAPVERAEQYAWFLAPAALFAAIGLWRELPVRARRRQILRRAAGVSGFAPRATVAGVSVVISMSWIVKETVFAHEEGHEYSAEVTAAGKLRWLVEDLAQHSTIRATDLSLLAERTINYALETLARGNAVEPGTLRDALLAVDFGERMDATAADWTTLRSLLRRNLAQSGGAVDRPPEIKKEALDEEDRPSQTNGQGSQQTTAESIGQGGASKTDASLGELRKESAKRVAAPKRASGALRAGGNSSAGNRDGSGPDPLRALTEKRFQDVANADAPGILYRALSGGPTAAEGGRDW
jgi:Ca-activated chloride channel homolog